MGVINCWHTYPRTCCAIPFLGQTTCMMFKQTPVPASVPPLEVVLTGGSPRVNESSVEAEFVTTRPVTGVRCFLRYENKNDYKDCEYTAQYYEIVSLFMNNMQVLLVVCPSLD